MSKYSYFNIFKRQAKAFAHEHGLKLAAAQEQCSSALGFVDFHELTTVAKRNPTDVRLMACALGTNSLGDLVYEESVYSALELEVEDALSGVIAETNADAFTIEDLEILDSSYDASTGTVLLTTAFHFVGEQDPDRVYHGSAFYIEAKARLQLRGNEWKLRDGDGLEINAYERDLDRDYWAEQEAAPVK